MYCERCSVQLTSDHCQELMRFYPEGGEGTDETVCWDCYYKSGETVSIVNSGVYVYICINSPNYREDPRIEKTKIALAKDGSKPQVYHYDKDGKFLFESDLRMNWGNEIADKYTNIWGSYLC